MHGFETGSYGQDDLSMLTVVAAVATSTTVLVATSIGIANGPMVTSVASTELLVNVFCRCR